MAEHLRRGVDTMRLGDERADVLPQIVRAEPGRPCCSCGGTPTRVHVRGRVGATAAGSEDEAVGLLDRAQLVSEPPGDRNPPA